MLEALHSKLIPLFLPKSQGDAAEAVFVNQMCLGKFLHAEAKHCGTVCLLSQPPKEGDCIQISNTKHKLGALLAAGMCWELLGKVLVGTGQAHATDCSNHSLAQTLALWCLGTDPAVLEFTGRAVLWE